MTKKRDTFTSLIIILMISIHVSDGNKVETKDSVALFREVFKDITALHRVVNGGSNVNNDDHESAGQSELVRLYPGDLTSISSNEEGNKNSEKQVHRWLIIPNECQLDMECSWRLRGRGRSRDKSRPGGRSKLRRQRIISSVADSCVNKNYLQIISQQGRYTRVLCQSQTSTKKFKGEFVTPTVVVFNNQRPSASGGKNNFICNLKCNTIRTNIAVNQVPKGSGGLVFEDDERFTGKARPSRSQPLSSLSSNCHCGRGRRGRVVCPPSRRDCSVSKNSIPWQAALIWRNTATPWCGGTVINDRYVLTAAHCLRNKDQKKIQVVLGEHDWSTRTESVDARFRIIKVITHPRYNEKSEFDYDIALIKLDKKIDITRFTPVCLPYHEERASVPLHVQGMVSGWGVVDPNSAKQSETLQSVQLDVLDSKVCRSKYTNINEITSSMFCAQRRDRDACYGDSGGPFTTVNYENSGYKDSGGKAVLVGVISWGYSCAKGGYPGVFANVARVVNWIRSNTLDASYC